MGRGTFTFRIVYFKPNGKMYVSDTFQLETAMIGPDHNHPSMADAVEHIETLRNNGGPMPGIRGCWSGPILVDHPEGYPNLILGVG